jgi:very-short-patch-repair endonuclease
MRPQLTARQRKPLDEAIAELAAKQQGVVSRAQLLGLGASAAAIQRRQSCGRLHPVHRGVFLVGHVARAPHATEMAAVLACGEGASISHRSAAFVWQITDRPPAEVDVMVPVDWAARRRGIAPHRCVSPVNGDVCERSGVPVTSVERTLLDLATILSPAALEWHVGRAFAAMLTSQTALATRVELAAGRRGVRRLRSLLAEPGGPAFTRSPPERRLLSMLRRTDLPRPEVNATTNGYELDFLWRDARLVVEVDGYAYHSDPLAFERDRLRDAELQALGYRVMRVTRLQLLRAPEAVIARIRRALRATER